MPYFSVTSDLSKPGVHAVLMPMTSRKIEMRVLFVPPSRAIHLGDGNTIETPWLELSKPTWAPLPEGEFLPEPFLSGTTGDDKGTLAVLQAMVDLGHKLGLTPTGVADRSAEIAALRYHLEDMRSIAGLKAATKP